MKDKAKYVRWGLTAFLVGCALLIFYDVFYRDNAGTVQAFFGKLWSILAPVLYGLAMAYLLAPLVNHLERWILRAKDALEKKRGRSAPVRRGLLRAVSILLTWAVVLVVLYLLFAMLIPQLVDSVTTLISNLETYYNQIYAWVTNLLEKNPIVSTWLSDLVNRYYSEATNWLTTELLPGLQATLTSFTGSLVTGVWSVIPFFGPFLGAIPSALLILLVSPLQCLYFVLFILLLQQLDGNVIGPKILGGSTGISSLWVIIAILVGGGFGGVLGMFLGVPIFACLQVLVRWLVNTRLQKKHMPLEASAYVNRDHQASETPPDPPEGENK